MHAFHRNTPRLALVAALALSCAHPAAAIIDSVSGCRPNTSGPVFIYADRTNSLTVKGGGVDLAIGVEDTGLAGVSAQIGERKHGIGSTVEVRVSVRRDIRHGDEGRIHLKYPIGEDTFPVKLVGLVTVTSMSIEEVSPSDGRFFLDLNRDYTLVVRGAHLDIYDAPSDMNGTGARISTTLLSRTSSEARIRIRSSIRHVHTIEPVHLRVPTCSAPLMEGSAKLRLAFGSDPSDRPAPAPGGGAPPPPRPPSSGGPPTSSGPTQTNLLPVRLFPERPLLRKINTLPSVMVPIALCGNLGNDEEGDRPLPDFEWGVSNTEFAVTVPFQIQLVNGATGATLATQTVPSIPRGDFRSFKNWPGRPATVRLVRVVARLLRDYDNSPGCYIARSVALSVPLDPRPILIRVDTTNVVPEGERENDNELRID